MENCSTKLWQNRLEFQSLMVLNVKGVVFGRSFLPIFLLNVPFDGKLIPPLSWTSLIRYFLGSPIFYAAYVDASSPLCYFTIKMKTIFRRYLLVTYISAYPQSREIFLFASVSGEQFLFNFVLSQSLSYTFISKRHGALDTVIRPSICEGSCAWKYVQ